MIGSTKSSDTVGISEKGVTSWLHPAVEQPEGEGVGGGMCPLLLKAKKLMVSNDFKNHRLWRLRKNNHYLVMLPVTLHSYKPPGFCLKSK